MRRTKQREQAFFLIFEEQFSGGEPAEAVQLYSENVEELGEYAVALFQGVCANREAIDEIIAANLKGWKLYRVSKVNLSILRLAVYEIFYDSEIPDSVAINEAVELAKKYSGPEDSGFINGVLGAVVRGKE
ncbi:MAG: transcription antitermination factor NusB [Eubacterium sp.]|nr:transcription antitermination factor NusB [Eubacterium sp.]